MNCIARMKDVRCQSSYVRSLVEDVLYHIDARFEACLAVLFLLSVYGLSCTAMLEFLESLVGSFLITIRLSNTCISIFDSVD